MILCVSSICTVNYFYSRPCGRGDPDKLSEGIKAHISTHAPAGGATMAILSEYRSVLDFYSRPCGRGDRQGSALSRCGSSFLLTPLREGRPTPARRRTSCRGISTHAPAGGATLASIEITTPPTKFLLTPLREGRQEDRASPAGRVSISTHAPAGGATDGVFLIAGRRVQISTHAPAGGATFRRDGWRGRRADFYSRPCGRGDSNFPQVRHEVLRQIAER